VRSPFPGAVGTTISGYPLPPKSVYADARCEAEKHKWIESERLGRDLGQKAIEDWYCNFWGRFCRACRLEHLFGAQKWVEFAEDEFGRIRPFLTPGPSPLYQLIERFEQGWENLHFMLWVHESCQSRDEIERIIDLLAIMDINIARLEPRL
jgi:hypothetical protein